MNGLLSFFLVGATAIGAVDEQAPKPKIDVSAQIYMPDGKASGASRRIDIGTDPVVLYVYTGKTLCEARTVSTEKPVVAGNGWKVTLTPFKSMQIIGVKSSLPKDAVEVKASWQRLWEGGKEVANGQSESKVLALGPGSVVPLDTIDGGGRRAARESAARMQEWKAGDPIPEDLQRDPTVLNLAVTINRLLQDRMKLKAENSYGDGHPRVMKITTEINANQKALSDRLQLLISSGGAASSPIGTTAVDGCAALSMNLQVQSVETATTAPVFEIDYWLVHRDPAGKETTQHQVVRTRAPNSADFFFDDIRVETERGPVTVEVFGGTGSPWVNNNGSTGMNFGVSRRYVTTSSGFPWKTKEGRNDFGSSFNAGEVLSFTLPPVPNDDGALVGHRFSLRIKMRVLQ